MNRTIPEMTFLLTRVEQAYGKRVCTPYDFETLSYLILEKTGKYISISTLKRIWDYVPATTVPRSTTLDILCKYVGHKDFITFCNDLKNNTSFTSRFFSAKCLNASDIEAGQTVTITWMPNRTVRLKYLGEGRFRVIEQHNSKLMEGDEFERQFIMTGYPLMIQRILRNGEYTPTYIAGSEGGICSITVE